MGIELQALTRCLDKLPEKQRDLINRYYASPKTRMAEVAGQLGRNAAGLYKALERTRDALRECVKRQIANEEPS